MHTQPPRRWPWILLVIVLFLVGFVLIAVRWVSQVSPTKVLENKNIQNTIVHAVGEEHRETVELLPTFLGFEAPKTYLILFLNNTEMRPGGGFIGSYATVRFDKGHINILKLEGVEKLDRAAPKEWIVEPPEIIKKELGLDRWFFRDSNWNIDFSQNAQRAKQFYAAEGGVAAEDIDMVIAVTPTVVEKLLAVIGPVTVQNVEFTSENVVETLEYEVEFGYKNKGISFDNRKQIMKPLFQELLKKTGELIFFSPKEFEAIGKQLVEEKHILAYSETEKLEKLIQKYHVAGAVTQHDGDYVQWVDANLAALKTDHAIKRNLEYSLRKGDQNYKARLQMNYVHTGTFDWRTSRYRTFARAYVPAGSKLLSASRINQKGGVHAIALDQITIEQEANKQSFGYFMIIEPGSTASLIFEYELPADILAHIDVGNYQLDVQKQAGIIEMDLTLQLDFDKKVQVATPAESRNFWGDDTYTYQTTIRSDEWFSVGF